MKQIRNTLNKLGPNSLRVSLAIGIAGFSAVELGSLAFLTTWKIQHILIDSHKQNLEQLVNRLPQHVELYSEILPLQISL